MVLLPGFLIALGASAALTPLVIVLARRFGWIVQPREDRWHKKPTAMYGGAAICAAFMLAFLLAGPKDFLSLVMALCGLGMFVVGLWDDVFEMKPQLKFLCQLIIAMAAVSQGITIDLIPWPWAAGLATVFWLVAITNAVNILDNMDGLSSGVVWVAGSVLAFSSYLSGNLPGGLLAVMLAGAALGFWFYNFNPAKIFMGDCGSLFLGFTLAAQTVLSANAASHAGQLIFVLLIPLGALVVPIFDTTLVSFQRPSHGRSIAQGGRDHSSHRLVFLGLSERKAVLVLLLISLGCGCAALGLYAWASPLAAMVIVALVLVVFIFFGIYLSEVKVYGEGKAKGWRNRSPILHKVLMHKKQMLQITLDVVLLSAAYAGAWLLRFEGYLVPYQMDVLAKSLPWLLAAKLALLWVFGLYRGEWRYISVYELVQMGKACVAGSALSVLLFVGAYGFQGFSRSVIIIDLLLCYMFLTTSRGLLRVFREKVRGKSGINVLLFGAGDGGELLLREISNNPRLPYLPVGFLDDDPAKLGYSIHGVPVLGSRRDLPELVRRHQVRKVFISILSAEKKDFADVFAICKDLDIDCIMVQPLIRI